MGQGGGDPRVRAGRPEDLPALRTLLAQVFSETVGERAVWKYLRNPVLPDPIVAVAEDRAGRLVGCYPFVGRLFWDGAAPRLAVLAADVAVAPAYRGGVLYAELAILAANLARRAGAAFAYGFPNPDAYRVARRLLHVRDWAVLEAWVTRLHQPSGALLRRSLHWIAPGTEAPASHPPPISPLADAGLRDPAFLAWRFPEGRGYRLRAVGPAYLVAGRGDRLGRDTLVVDFGPAAAGRELQALLDGEVAAARVRGAERLWIWCLSGSAMARAALGLGFRRAPDRDKPVTVDPLEREPPSRPAHLTIADADDP